MFKKLISLLIFSLSLVSCVPNRLSSSFVSSDEETHSEEDISESNDETLSEDISYDSTLLDSDFDIVFMIPGNERKVLDKNIFYPNVNYLMEITFEKDAGYLDLLKFDFNPNSVTIKPQYNYANTVLKIYYFYINLSHETHHDSFNVSYVNTIKTIDFSVQSNLNEFNFIKLDYGQCEKFSNEITVFSSYEDYSHNVKNFTTSRVTVYSNDFDYFDLVLIEYCSDSDLYSQEFNNVFTYDKATYVQITDNNMPDFFLSKFSYAIWILIKKGSYQNLKISFCGYYD